MLIVPLGSAATLPNQAASLGGHSGLMVRTTPQVSRPADAWSYISGAWNRLNSATAEAPPRPPAAPVHGFAPPPIAPSYAATQPLELNPMPGVAPRSAAPQPVGSAAPWSEYVRRCTAINGLLECCVFDIESQRSLAHSGSPRMAERLAAKGTMLHAMMNDTAKVLGLASSHPDAAITLEQHYLLLRPLPGHPNVALHLLLDRSHADIGRARAQLQQIDQALLGAKP
jgi:hypothetical protein